MKWHGNRLAGATGLQPHSPKDEVLLWDQQIFPHDENRKELNSSGSLLKVTFCCTQHLQIRKEGVYLSTCKKKTRNIKLHCKSMPFLQRISHLEAIYSPHKEPPSADIICIFYEFCSRSTFLYFCLFYALISTQLGSWSLYPSLCFFIPFICVYLSM